MSLASLWQLLQPPKVIIYLFQLFANSDIFTIRQNLTDHAGFDNSTAVVVVDPTFDLHILPLCPSVCYKTVTACIKLASYIGFVRGAQSDPPASQHCISTVMQMCVSQFVWLHHICTRTAVIRNRREIIFKSLC